MSNLNYGHNDVQKCIGIGSQNNLDQKPDYRLETGSGQISGKKY